jgi:hypothetical protein
MGDDMLADVIIYPRSFRTRKEGELHELTGKVGRFRELAEEEYKNRILSGEKPLPQKLLEIFGEKLKQNNIPYIYLRKVHLPDEKTSRDQVIEYFVELYKPVLEEKFYQKFPSDIIITEIRSEYKPVAEDAIDPPEASPSNNIENMVSLLLLSIPVVTLIGLWLSNIFKK